MSDAEKKHHATEWRKALRSTGNGECVEVASRTNQILMRDSKEPNGVTLNCGLHGWGRLVAAIKSGVYDVGR